ncbi:LutC/YkgG family protein [Methyloversatilis discipulorum]|uniref:LutC/YkgG family protein n=1 Tax=Methyloversatilis discipulorum TaxID=1119528 RepID=UPI001A39F4D6|nr:LUD domain-containing protein [Methyloversatilis discipulorum]MBL8468137.1 LUD domain-containing protein [Methyloversatilis discipulorum]
MSARERILARLRAAEPGAPVTPPDVTAYYAQRPRLTPAERLQQLSARLRASRAEVMVAQPAEWARVAADALHLRGVSRVALNSDVRADELAATLPSAIEAVRLDGAIEHWKQEMFATIDAGFTPASAGIAATGALLLNHGGALPRTLSLVPPISLVCVDARDLYDDLHHASSSQRWADDMPTNRVLVSSPSRTADIQQTLAYGAHGPRELVVVVIADGDLA